MKTRSKILAIATVLATAYSIYMICYFVGGTANAKSTEEAVVGAIATALVAPHMILFSIGAIFGWIGLFLRASWSALVAAILYSVATLFFLIYIMYGAPILILGFIGYAKQKKINKLNPKE